MKIGFITFKDFLFVHDTSKNLLSISSLTTQNDLSMLFPDKYCIVKDNHGGLFLVNGIDEKKVERLL